MNRELKFRVWDKQDKSFLSEEYLKHFKVAISWDGKSVYQNFICGDKKVDDEVIIQQYTGLKDSKGVEIYEGDIVKYHFNNPDITWVDLVAWESYGWVLLHFDGTESGATPLVPIPSMEIIGNIFENKELLNQ
jgi:uncharacterized phage protein (TIGR01671 family)